MEVQKVDNNENAKEKQTENKEREEIRVAREVKTTPQVNAQVRMQQLIKYKRWKCR